MLLAKGVGGKFEILIKIPAKVFQITTVFQFLLALMYTGLPSLMYLIIKI